MKEAPPNDILIEDRSPAVKALTLSDFSPRVRARIKEIDEQIALYRELETFRDMDSRNVEADAARAKIRALTIERDALK